MNKKIVYALAVDAVDARDYEDYYIFCIFIKRNYFYYQIKLIFVSINGTY